MKIPWARCPRTFQKGKFMKSEEERRIDNLCELLEELEETGRDEEAGNLRWAIFEIEANVLNEQKKYQSI